jgi:CRISPR-associated protein Cmr4
MMYLFIETPLHAGSGQGIGSVDQPIQRERSTGYPLVQASGVKGKLRAEAEAWATGDKSKMAKVDAVFGPAVEIGGGPKHAGALSPGDARILLLPVRSLAGVFAWTTSANVIARFQRDMIATGVNDLEWNIPPLEEQALVAPDNQVTAGDKVVLEEISYTPQENDVVETIGGWLAENALPDGEAYNYWRDKLPKNLVILPEDDFRDFALYATEVVTRIRIDNDTKTVAPGALWTEESLPVDTLMYTPLYAMTSRNSNGSKMDGKKVMDFITDLKLNRVQLGGDETVGRGLVALRYGEVQDV